MRPRLLHWEEVEGSPADTGRRGRKLMELKRSTKSSVWWGSKTMEESGFVCGMSEEGEDWKWDNKPLRGFGFKTISRRLIARWTFSFTFCFTLVLEQNSLSLAVV